MTKLNQIEYVEEIRAFPIIAPIFYCCLMLLVLRWHDEDMLEDLLFNYFAINFALHFSTRSSKAHLIVAMKWRSSCSPKYTSAHP